MRDRVTRCDRPIIKSGRIPERERCGQGARIKEAEHWGPTELTGTREYGSRGGQRGRVGTPTRALAGSI